MITAGACGNGDRELVAFAVAGENPVANTLWCEPGDLVADLNPTSSFPPNIEVRALDEGEARQRATDFVETVFSDNPAASAQQRLVHDGGPTAAMVLSWPDATDANGAALPGGWLTFALVESEWTITGYTVCNRFAFGA